MEIEVTSSILSIIASFVACVCYCRESDVPDRFANISHPGHLKSFGAVGPFLSVDETKTFPGTTTFFHEYVFRSRPLKMTGVAQLSPAFHKWTDDYFLETVVDPKRLVFVEMTKKENRTSMPERVHFHEFVRQYNSTNYYMVDDVPDEFRADVVLPGPLQCRLLYEDMLVEVVMWMSSGGTSSVVHIDSVDNIICSFRGKKMFILVDPSLYKEKVLIDHPEGGYSGIDVDRVDYEQYSGLSDVEFYKVSLSAGDCLYVPFEWIHQVRSYQHNVAVNILWLHQRSVQLNLNTCSDIFDISLTLDKTAFHGFPQIDRKEFAEIIGNGVSLSEFVSHFISGEDDVDGDRELVIQQIFVTIDINKDGWLSVGELNSLSNKEWGAVESLVQQLDEQVTEADSIKTEL